MAAVTPRLAIPEIRLDFSLWSRENVTSPVVAGPGCSQDAASAQQHGIGLIKFPSGPQFPHLSGRHQSCLSPKAVVTNRWQNNAWETTTYFANVTGCANSYHFGGAGSPPPGVSTWRITRQSDGLKHFNAETGM